MPDDAQRHRPLFVNWLVASWLRKLLGLSGLLLAGYSAVAQSRWQADPVLSQLLIHQMVQDTDGFLWVATNDGVYRYDGYQTVPIRQLDARHPQLPMARYQLALGRHGELWLFGKPGLFCYSTTRQHLMGISLPPGRGGYLAERQAIAIDTIHNRLWLNSNGRNVLLLQRRYGQLVSAGEWTFPCMVSALTPAATGGVWAQTANNQRITYLTPGHQPRSYEIAGEDLVALPDTRPQQFVSAQALYEAGAGGRLRETRRWLVADKNITPFFMPALQPGNEQWVASHQQVRLRRQAATGQVTGALLEPTQLRSCLS